MRCATREGTRLRVGPRKRTVGYVEEADRAQRGQSGALRRCSRPGVRNAGLGDNSHKFPSPGKVHSYLVMAVPYRACWLSFSATLRPPFFDSFFLKAWGAGKTFPRG